MGFVHGKNTAVYLGGLDLSTWLNAADVSVDVDIADSSRFKLDWKTHVVGAAGSKANVSGLYDPAQTALPDLILSQVPGILTTCPAGDAYGLPANLLRATSVSDTTSSPVGGIVAIKAAFMADGVVGMGRVLTGGDVVSGTTDWDSLDGLGATTTGWTLHVHVLAVSGGSTWAVRVLDATSEPGTTLVSGAEITGIVAAGAHRLTGAAGATVRRWVGFEAEKTAGTGNLTVFAAFARQ